MSFRRDITLQQMDHLQRSSLAYQYANYGLGLTYDALPDEVVHQAKRVLLDTIGCAIGGFDAPGRPLCEGAVQDMGGVAEATVIGSGLRTNATNANLVNSFLVRFLDFNDLSSGGHNSDSLPSLLAIAERQKASGRDFVTALVVSYELAERVNAGITNWHGYLGETRAPLIVPPAIGRMMGMNAEQIAHAIGIAACGNATFGILDVPGEEKPMRKNFRFGWGASAAIVACLLAKRGFTGPVRIFEGEKGINDVMLHGEADMEAMTDFRGWRTMNAHFKYLCAVVTSHGVLQATLEIVRENDLKPEDIAEVVLTTNPMASTLRPTTPAKYPRNAETADHSAYYLAAVAIKDREVSADSILAEKFTDPVIIDLVEKIRVVGDASIPPMPKVKYVSSTGMEGTSVITTKDGRRFERHVLNPKGFWGDTLSDRELEEKFTKLAEKHISATRITALFETIWNVEKLDDMGALMKLTVF